MARRAEPRWASGHGDRLRQAQAGHGGSGTGDCGLRRAGPFPRVSLVHVVASRAKKIHHPFLCPASGPPPASLPIFGASQRPGHLTYTDFPSSGTVLSHFYLDVGWALAHLGPGRETPPCSLHSADGDPEHGKETPAVAGRRSWGADDGTRGRVAAHQGAIHGHLAPAAPSSAQQGRAFVSLKAGPPPVTCAPVLPMESLWNSFGFTGKLPGGAGCVYLAARWARSHAPNSEGQSGFPRFSPAPFSCPRTPSRTARDI